MAKNVSSIAILNSLISKTNPKSVAQIFLDFIHRLLEVAKSLKMCNLAPFLSKKRRKWHYHATTSADWTELFP